MNGPPLIMDTEVNEAPPGRRLSRAARREEASLQFVIDLVYERTRIRLHDGKQALIRARLGKRMRALGFEHLTPYCDFLQTPAGTPELVHVIDALTTNHTCFMREEDHFRFIVQQALPTLLGPHQRRFRVWSAACSSGEEPFSLAIYLDEAFPLAQGWDWQILATDISTKVLAKAEAAIYPADRVETMPAALLRRHFQRGVGQTTGWFRVKPRLRERVLFRRVNLLELEPMQERFEVVLCRNVMIYFDRATQLQLVTGLARFLVPHGYLLIGHAESLNGLATPFRCLRPSYYQKL